MKDKLNIAMVSYQRPHLGGSGIMTNELAKALAKEGHSIHMVSYPGTYLTESEEGLGMTMHPVEDINYPCFKAEPYSETLAGQLTNIEKDHGRLDVIHANYAITHGLAALVAKEIIRRKRGDGSAPRTVITCHGSDIHTNGSSELLYPTIEYLLLEADDVTYVSKALRNEAEKLYPKTNGNGKVIYNFIDTERFNKDFEGRDEKRYRLGLGIDDIVVYHASNFRPVKNTGLIVDAAELLYTDRNLGNIKFLMVGEGPELSRLKAEIDKRGLRAYFKIAGRTTDVVPYINACDVGLLSSKRESFGLALLETMACELPVIGSNTGGIPEVIEEGKNGYIFESENARDLADKIILMTKDSERRKEMGKRSLEIAKERFTPQWILPQYLDVYRGINKPHEVI